MVRHDDELVEDDAVKMQRNLDPHTRDRRAEVAEQYAVIHDRAKQAGAVSSANRDEIGAGGRVVVRVDTR
jgi:hypothetical protein